jgi:hypothetical protein
MKAEFHGKFLTDRPEFETTRDCDISSLANALAAEKWVKGFADGVRENHQNHIEQFGRITGVLTVDGRKIQIDSPAIRDRSNGRRRWSDMNLHMWIEMLTDDGELYNISTVRYPSLNVAGIIAGYKSTSAGNIALVGLEIPDGLGRSGDVPKTAKMKMTFADKTVAEIEYDEEMTFLFPFENGEYIIYEGVASAMINGKHARGITEFGYNKDKTRYKVDY